MEPSVMMGLAVAALAWLFYDCITGSCAFVAFRELAGMV